MRHVAADAIGVDPIRGIADVPLGPPDNRHLPAVEDAISSRAGERSYEPDAGFAARLGSGNDVGGDYVPVSLRAPERDPVADAGIAPSERAPVDRDPDPRTVAPEERAAYDEGRGREVEVPRESGRAGAGPALVTSLFNMLWAPDLQREIAAVMGANPGMSREDAEDAVILRRLEAAGYKRGDLEAAVRKHRAEKASRMA